MKLNKQATTKGGQMDLGARKDHLNQEDRQKDLYLMWEVRSPTY
jgi:hypothetical protein